MPRRVKQSLSLTALVRARVDTYSEHVSLNLGATHAARAAADGPCPQ
jgi:hypothetical protein